MVLLGSTGSIGVNALKIAKEFQIDIEVLVAGRNINLLNQQILEFSPKIVVIQDKRDLHAIRAPHTRVLVGDEGIKEAIRASESKLVLNAIVGSAGLMPSFYALEYEKDLALANKESLVLAGWLLQNYSIRPVDSEHFGLWYLLDERKKISSMTITASGGAFRNTPLKEIPYKKPEDALKHPNWKMGKKITIDSASMVNKLFEILEARWLFGDIALEAVIESTSSIHAFVSFEDGSTTAHISNPDMRLPIAYAIDPKKARDKSLIQKIDLTKMKPLIFEEINPKRYPLWSLKDKLLNSPQLGIVLHSANEVLVEAFLNKKILFGQIADGVFRAMEKFEGQCGGICEINHILELQKEIQLFVKQGLGL